MTTTLPKVGTILEYAGRRAVVIGIAGTANRGTMPKRSCDPGHRSNGTITGVHVQLLDTGSVDTVRRSELRACTVVSAA